MCVVVGREVALSGAEPANDGKGAPHTFLRANGARRPEDSLDTLPHEIGHRAARPLSDVPECAGLLVGQLDLGADHDVMLADQAE
jgi:hypothetical protein